MSLLISDACLFSPGPCCLEELIFLLTARVFRTSRREASLEVKTLGQVLFHARVGKEAMGNFRRR